MSYEERLAAVEAKIEAFEDLHKQLQQELKVVLEDRPCDFYLEWQGRVWTEFHNTRGEKTGFGWSVLPPSHPSVYKAKRKWSAKEYADYLQGLKKIDQIEIKELPC